MCQRVDFARALVVEPDALLMDEAFSALDVLTGANLRADLLDLWASADFPTKAIRALVDFLYDIMTGHPETDAAGPAMAAPQAASPAELPLPLTSVGGLDGMLRILGARGGRGDLPELAGHLSLEVNDLIPLTDPAQLLGFAEVDNANIKLTPVRQQWGQASPSDDKKIFAEQARDRAA